MSVEITQPVGGQEPQAGVAQTPAGTETPTPTPVAPAAPEGAAAGAEGQAQAGEDRSAELPEWAQEELRSVRSEAGKFRIERNNLRATVDQMQEQLKAAKSQEDVDAAVAEWRGKVEQLEAASQRQTAIAKALSDNGLSADDAQFLTGDTPEALTESAKKLALRLGASSTSLSGGMAPTVDAGTASAVDDKVAELRSRRPF